MAKKRKSEKAPREMTHRQLSHHKKQQRRQRIFFFGGIGIIVAVVLIIVGGWLAGEYLPMHKTIIQVYDKTFDTAYFIDTLVIYGQAQGPEALVGITNDVINQIMRYELQKQEAAKLGISISDEEARQYWQNPDIPITDASLDLARGQLLPDKLKGEHFDDLVPLSDNQVNLRAMMVESDTVAQLVREKIVSGENFSMLVEQYAVDDLSISNNGSYGFHPASVLEAILNSIPLNYVFSADVKPGDVSPPLSDNKSDKQTGYWLIRVNDRPSEDSANVSAVYLGSQEEALAIMARLEAGEELAPIADEYSQHSTSRQNHGEMGITVSSDNISNAYNGYIFGSTTKIGEWSQPLRDEFYTKGGAWIVQVVDKEDNKELTDEDRNTLIEKLYADWYSDIWTAASPFMVNYMTDELQVWAIERASR